MFWSPWRRAELSLFGLSRVERQEAVPPPIGMDPAGRAGDSPVSDYTTPHAHPSLVQPAGTAYGVPYAAAELRGGRRMSWGSILAGVAVALVTQALLALLGIGLGVATLDPATGQSPNASTLSIAAAAWYGVSGLIAAFAGGWVAGRLSQQPAGGTAGVHGLATWATTTLVILFMLSGAVTGLLGGALNGVTNVLGGVAQGAGSAIQGTAPALAQQANPFSGIEQQLRETTGGQDPAELRDNAISAVRSLLTGDASDQQQARERAAQALARARSVPVDEARAQIGQYEQQYRATAQRLRDQATQAAQTAAEVVSRAALISFGVMVLGALCGFVGGRMGAPKGRVAYD
jgi:hypothetical protein